MDGSLIWAASFTGMIIVEECECLMIRGAYGAFYMSNTQAKSVRIVSCSLAHGYFQSSGWVRGGSGSSAEMLTIHIENCDVSHSTTSSGGGVLNGYSPTWSIEDSDFLDCSSSGTGAEAGVWISLQLGFDVAKEISVKRCSFDNDNLNVGQSPELIYFQGGSASDTILFLENISIY
jgi:hypothetical protein